MAEDINEMKAGAHGLVGVKSAAGVLAAREREREAALPPKVAEKSTLSSYVTAVFNENRDHRRTSGVDEQLLDALRRRNGEYSPEKLAAIQKQGGSDIFAEITGVKCRNAESWLSDVFSPDDEKSWALKPTPVPELPQEVADSVNRAATEFAMRKAGQSMQAGQPVSMQQIEQVRDEAARILEGYVQEKMKAESAKRVRNMERKMYDQLLESDWDKVLDEFLYDLTTYQVAVLKGPIIRMRKTRSWKIMADGTSELVIDREPHPVFERVSPFDIYPSPLAKSADGPGPIVERLRITRSSLEDMKEYEGYNAAEIDRILKEQDFGTSTSLDEPTENERRILENRGEDEDASENQDSINGYEFHGNVPGHLLIDHGITEDNYGKLIRRTKEYSAEIIQISDTVVYASLNPDKLDRHPYSSTSWSKTAGSFWGRSVPHLLTPIQDVCNASLRALVNNMGFASGPQVAVTDIDRIPLNENLTDVYPFKLWQFTNERNITTDPVKFFLIPSNASELYTVYENFKKQADDDSGIPAYAYGNERTAGAGRTASGLSMLMTGASRGIKKVIRNVHRDVIRPCLVRLYDWNMQYDPDPSIKGDADIVAVGAVAVLTREQASTRRLELLNFSNNPTDLKIFGVKNRAELWRQTLDTLEFDGDTLVLSDDELDELVQAEQQQMAQMQQVQDQAVQTEMQAKIEELKIKQQMADQKYEIELAKLDAGSAEAQSAELLDIAKMEMEKKKDDKGSRPKGSK